MQTTHSHDSEEKLLQMRIFRQSMGYQVSRTQRQSLGQGQVEYLRRTENQWSWNEDHNKQGDVVKATADSTFQVR